MAISQIYLGINSALFETPGQNLQYVILAVRQPLHFFSELPNSSFETAEALLDPT